MKLIKWFYNNLYRIRPPEFVQYWKTGDNARCKWVILEDGSYAMYIEGEKYPLYGFPRGPVLFGPLARLKYLAKNLVFNQSWKMLEEGKSGQEVMAYIKSVALPVLLREVKTMKYDMFPPERMCPVVREIWRVMSFIENQIQDEDEKEQFKTMKEGITFFFQEDDAYRFRLSWIAKYLNPNHFLRKIWYIGRKYSFRKELEWTLNFLENAEVTPDMKGRARLIKKVLFAFLDDPELGKIFDAIVKELNWKKLCLSKADTYYFRGKYFKVDLDHFDY